VGCNRYLIKFGDFLFHFAIGVDFEIKFPRVNFQMNVTISNLINLIQQVPVISYKPLRENFKTIFIIIIEIPIFSATVASLPLLTSKEKIVCAEWIRFAKNNKSHFKLYCIIIIDKDG
jgi:hypothetical protein